MKIAYTYEANSGAFLCDGVKVADGYSGAGAGRNNPELEAKRSIGPIPRGTYIVGQPHFSDKVGPISMYLTPVGHDACGRSGLMIHGDNRTNNASRGCIILARTVRQEVADYWKECSKHDHVLGLEVV